MEIFTAIDGDTKIWTIRSKKEKEQELINSIINFFNGKIKAIPFELSDIADQPSEVGSK